MGEIVSISGRCNRRPAGSGQVPAHARAQNRPPSPLISLKSTTWTLGPATLIEAMRLARQQNTELLLRGVQEHTISLKVAISIACSRSRRNEAMKRLRPSAPERSSSWLYRRIDYPVLVEYVMLPRIPPIFGKRTRRALHSGRCMRSA